MKKLFSILILLLWASVAHAQPIPEIVIDPLITRDAEIIPTGETNAICIANTATPQPAITLCSTLALTGKTVLYKIPEYAFGSIPAGNPLVIVTNSSSAALCNDLGAIKAVCWHNGTSYVSLSGGGGVADPGANGLAIRSALNTLIARSLATASSGRIAITNPDGVAGNPTFDTGSDVPLKSGSNDFTGSNNFSSVLRAPRKATPGDIGLLLNGEFWIDGELLKYKSNTGVVYTLYKIGDAIVRAILSSAEPTPDDDTADGYSRGDIWINDAGTPADNADDTIYIAVSVLAGAARWQAIGAGGGLDVSASPAWTGVHTFVADSFATGVHIGSSDRQNGIRGYQHASEGFKWVCVVAGVEDDCDYLREILTGKKWGVADVFEITGGTGLTRLLSGTQTTGDCAYFNGTIWTKVKGCRDGGFTYAVDREAGLLDTDDRNKFLRIPYDQTITEICATTDTGTSTINIQRDDGSAANILSSNLVAAGTEVCSTTFTSGENVLSEGHYLHFVMVQAQTSGTPTKLTISFNTTRTP